jgi:hypothetical protein
VASGNRRVVCRVAGMGGGVDGIGRHTWIA